MKMYCNVYDGGTTYLVASAVTHKTAVINFTVGDQLIEIENTAVYDSIVYNLAKKNTVRIPKNVNPITPSDLIVTRSDDELTIAKSAAISVVKNTINTRVGNIASYDFFEFNILNNKLISKGYSITEENKEDKYLEILDTGDESLIADLQKFLEVQTNISEYQTEYLVGKETLEKINDAVNIDEVETAKNEFLAKYI